MRQPRGQNFLVDTNIARQIVDAAGITAGDKVLEIGPGKGVLTALIAGSARQFKAIEIDVKLFENLKSKLAGSLNTEIILSDFLKYPFSNEQGPLKIVSNLPYNVSTPIIEKIIPEPNWELAIVMVQKEVGDRLAASPNNKQYGAFTVICGHYARFEKLFAVGPECFSPAPKVDSVVLKITNLRTEKLAPGFVGFIKSSFSQRRKTILNCVSNALNIPKNNAIKAFDNTGISPALRPENLSFEQFKTLHKNLSVFVD